ncbi:trypsin-like serine peptidase [Thiothrix fructosivorans]|uniref:Serine protease n=1 Tax=Thiothrix fructosivorans TaxID=111770 RepID=A0A8B0SDW7_9GAMM|nr:trypsin-like peptidase domain-containing protein [Thiothrix fructosivorans]MBO0614412.1 trypsin-like serine protease [Thiothrix fructosivorans]QTX09254.1 trypsin-like serine protease [Thiothrix fructosivorans]
MPAHYRHNTPHLALFASLVALTLAMQAHAQPDTLTDNAYESVIGFDSRYAVDANSYPYTAVARITYQNDAGACSGWFSSTNTLVTAGHCIFDKTTGQTLNINAVYPGYGGNRLTPVNGVCTVKKTYLYPEWLTNNDSAFDIGIIKLDCTRKDLQPLSYAYLPDSIDFRNVTLTISGYPADKNKAEFQWAGQGKLLDYNTHFLTYNNDTNGGMSGSPIWLDAGNGKPPLVIGVHTTGFSDANGAGTLNGGVHLTQQMTADIEAVNKLP